MKGIESAFIGVLSKDPESKTGRSGKPYANFSCTVAAPAGASPRSAASSEAGDPSWVNVICFGSIAEELVQRARKGDKVYVEGHLTLAKWENADGEARSGLAVSAWKVEKLGNIGRNRAWPSPDEIPIPERKPKHARPRAFGLFAPRLNRLRSAGIKKAPPSEAERCQARAAIR